MTNQRLRLFIVSIAIAILVGSLPRPLHAQDGRLSSGFLPAHATDFVFSHVTPAQGLSDIRVAAIAQDVFGFMWLGTTYGLNRYDGFEFKTYQHDPKDPNTLSHSRIRALYNDRSGMLWIGTEKGLTRYDPRLEAFTRFVPDSAGPDSLSGEKVTVIYEDVQGRLWVGTEDGGLNQLDRETGRFLHYRHDPADPQSLASDQVTSIAGDTDGTLWVGTYGGLDRLVSDARASASPAFVHYRHDPSDPASLSDDRVYALHVDRGGRLWIGTWEGGLNRYDPASGAFVRLNHVSHHPGSLGADRVTAIAEDASGNLWVGTWAEGIDVLAPDAQAFIHQQHKADVPQSLSNDAVRALFTNSTGQVWIGTLGGGSLFDPLRKEFGFLTIGDDAQGAESNGAHSVYQDKDGVLWAGTLTDGLYAIDRRTGVRVHYAHDADQPGSLSDNTVRALFADGEGVLWVGTYGGLDRLDRGTQTFTHFRHDPDDPASLSENTVYAIREDREGRLWVGTWDGLNVLDRATGHFTQYKSAPDDPGSLNSSSIGSIYEDATGELWIGTNGGFHRYDRASDSFVRYVATDDISAGPGAETIFSIHRDPSGWLWLGTWDGLIRFNPDTAEARRYTTADGLSSNTVWGILPDDEGNLWISTSQGLNRFSPLTETFVTFGATDGLPTDSFAVFAYHRGLDGELFFGTVAGLVYFAPQAIRVDLNPPPVVFTDLWVGRQPVTVGGNSLLRQSINATDAIELAHDDRVLSIGLAVLSFRSPDKSRFRYRLEGFDAGWVEVDSRRRFVTYTNLEPGNYVLRVKASNGDGVWSEASRSLRIAVVPPWWSTAWFQLLAGGLVVAIVTAIYVGRVGFLRRQNRRLEEAVAAKTAALQQAHLDQLQLRQEEAQQRRLAEERSSELSMLLSVIQDLVSTLDLDDLLRLLLDDLRQFAPYDFGVVFGLADRELVSLAARTAGAPVVLPATRIPAAPTADLLHRLAEQPVLVLAGGIQNESLRVRLVEVLAPYSRLAAANDVTWMAIPLAVSGRTIGVLILAQRGGADLVQDKNGVALALTGYAAVAMENAQLYSRARVAAADEERSRLARELHDAVTQTLFSAILIADVLPEAWDESPEAGREGLQELQQLMRGALAEMRALLLELRPAAIEKKPLGELLPSLCEAFTSRTKVPVDLSVTGDYQYPARLQIAFYRITQEALNNIMKHAQARAVQIALCCADNAISLTVKDDGVGLDPEALSAGRLGLTIMRERAEGIGARLSITSAPQAGTQIEVYWQDGSGQPGMAQ